VSPGRRRTRLLAIALATTALAGCATDGPRDGVHRTVTPQAESIEGLFWFSLALGVTIWLAVMALLAVPIVRSWRRRRRGDGATPGGRGPARLDAPAAEVDGGIAVADRTHTTEADADHRVRSRLIWIGGIVLPPIVLIILLIYSSVVAGATAHVPRDGELVVDVVGHMFWWEVAYEDLDIVTANEIVVPVDTPVRLDLATEDVIHSFWIPRIHGKIDMIPGRVNAFTFTATETGSFRGNCAEFCGIAHAQMVAWVHVVEQDEFDEWVEGQRQPAASASQDGEETFLDAGCAACHAVSGTDAVGRVGPDLTHLASRERLAAGIVPNTRQNLAELIVHPQRVKPGIAMPGAQLTDAELDDLLDYLEGLE
jgi:cytochrome c oxidase subunit 2